MTTVTELIKVVEASEAQDADGQFEVGSVAHQDATRLVEMFFIDHDKIVAELPAEEFQLTTAAVIAAMRDTQVRDYMLGTASNIKNADSILSFLTATAPEGYKNAPASILSMVYYEADKLEEAANMLAIADENYPLATLLKRVFNAGWPKESFAQMRNELHPKVVAGIFGDKE